MIDIFSLPNRAETLPNRLKLNRRRRPAQLASGRIDRSAPAGPCGRAGADAGAEERPIERIPKKNIAARARRGTRNTLIGKEIVASPGPPPDTERGSRSGRPVLRLLSSVYYRPIPPDAATNRRS
jgi:hypothetical protein